MPEYEYKCQSCGAIFSKYDMIEDMKQTASCPMCMSEARKIPSRVNVIGDLVPHYSVQLGDYVTSRQDLRMKAAAKGLAIVSPTNAEGLLSREEMRRKKRIPALKKKIGEEIVTSYKNIRDSESYREEAIHREQEIRRLGEANMNKIKSNMATVQRSSK